MSNPSLKDLPKVALDLKSELEGFNHGCMKKAATAEKNVLPSAEGKFITRSKIFSLICALTLEQPITPFLFSCNCLEKIRVCIFVKINVDFHLDENIIV